MNFTGGGASEPYFVLPPNQFNVILTVKDSAGHEVEATQIPEGPPISIPGDLVSIPAGSTQTFSTDIDLTLWYPNLVPGTYTVTATYVNFVKDPELQPDGTCAAGPGNCVTNLWLGTAPAGAVSVPVNRAPVFDAVADQMVNEGQLLQFTVNATDADNDPLTYSAGNLPSGAMFDPPTRTFRYTPGFDVSTSTSNTFFDVVFTVNDGHGGSTNKTVRITVLDVAGGTPTGTNVVVTPVDTTTGTSPVTVTFSNVVQPGVTSLTTSASGPAPPSGFQLAGSYYNLSTTAVFTGTVTVCIKYNDAGIADETKLDLFHFENNQWVTITISRDIVQNILCGNTTSLSPFAIFQFVNHPPTATGQSVTTAEDTAKLITLTGSDPDTDPLTFSVVTPPTRGTLTGTAPNVTYHPTSNLNGPDSFTFKVNDGKVDSAAATISITVTPVNDRPVADAKSVMTNEDTAIAITLSGSDVAPAANYNGPDSFTYTITDRGDPDNCGAPSTTCSAKLTSLPATVSITVKPVNDAPVADPKTVTTVQNTSVAITLSGTDVETAPANFTWAVGTPAHGTLSGTAPNLTYKPATNYNGPDSFTYTITDKADGASPPLTSAPALVSITVTPPIAFCSNASSVKPVLDPVSGRFPGNKGLDVIVKVHKGESLQTAITNAADTNGDGYILIGVVANDTGALGGHVTQSLAIDKAYAKTFGLIGCSVTLHDATGGDALPTAYIKASAGSPKNIYVSGLHAADSNASGWVVEGNGRTLNNSDVLNNAIGLKVLGNSNTVTNGSASNNGQAGIHIEGNSNTLSGFTVTNNQANGIEVTGNSNQLLKNNVGDIGKGNNRDGIHVTGAGNTLQENNVFANGGDGIEVSGGTSAMPNVLKKNRSGDVGKGNGGNGILLDGTGNGMGAPVELEENTTKSNARNGIRITGSGHQLKKNVSGGSSSSEKNGACPYSVAAGNFNSLGNTANGVAISGADGSPFPVTCLGTP
jgi:hypothetical protein